MMQILLIGLGAGVAAALLFVSPLSGTSLALPLFILTGLPVAIAGLGWTFLAAIAASAVAALLLALLASPTAAAIFLLLFGLPIVWLVRLAGLSRPTEAGREWYPLGRLLLHAAAAAAIGLTLVGLLIGFDIGTLTRTMSDMLTEWFRLQPELGTPPAREELEAFVRLNVILLPYTLAAMTLVVLVLQLWLASLITRASGRLERPREPMWQVEFPPVATPIFLGAVALSLLPHPLGSISATAAGTFGCAFALVGLAVLHVVTLGSALRPLMLTAVYGLIFFAGFPMLILALLGIAETYLHLRARRPGGAPPTPQ